MMDHADLLKLIRTEVTRAVRVILSGTSDTNDQFSEDIGNLYPGMGKFSKRPVMHPYGLASRAPSNTLQVTARQGDHPGNRIVLGHRDAARPVIAQQGEVALYNAYGQLIRVKNGQVLLGTDAATQPYVLGTIFQAFMSAFSIALETHTHAGPGAPPTNAAAFTTLRTQNVDNGAILSKIIVGV